MAARRAPAFFLAENLSGGRGAGALGADGPPSLIRAGCRRPDLRFRGRPC